MVLAVAPIVQILLVLGLTAGLAFTIFCIVDIVRRPQWAWLAAGKEKALWLALTFFGYFLCWIIMDIVYVAAIRPKVAAAQRGGPPAGGGDGDPNTYKKPYRPHFYSGPFS